MKHFSSRSIIVLTGILYLFPLEAQVSKQTEVKNSGPKKSTIAWGVQAKNVADDLELSTDITAQFVDIYVNARQTYKSAQHALPEMEDKLASRRITLELRMAEENKLPKKFGILLDQDQVVYACRILGSFNPKWDRQVRILLTFDLDEKKIKSAIKLVNQFNVDYQAYRTAGKNTKTLKKGLDEALAVFLNADQQTRWLNESAGKKKK